MNQKRGGKTPVKERGGRATAVAERTSPFSAQTFMVDGLAAVAEYVRFRPAALLEIRCTKRLRDSVTELLQRHQVKVNVFDREEEGAGGVQAPVSARVSLKALDFDACLKRLQPRTHDVVLALDHITDPRNLGAIVRSAAFFGVREVIVPERRQVLLTQAAVNTAQGGFALTELVVVTNLNRALGELKDLGYWLIGTQMSGEPFHKLARVYERSVVVLGAEDTGLSKGVSESCDRLASIPGLAGGLDSLNVSVAAGIILCEFTRPAPGS
ncbi:MAG: RNA methyltransferase [Proteobacteria bacterium]|nr:RNA methyltransferase [Pseudomonadota bacterium]